jgi:hypothetical protein
LNAPGAVNVGTGNFNELRFNGRSNQQNQTKLDGVEATAIFDASPGYVTVQGSQFRLATSIENIQEFRVDSSNYPAEYGTGTGGQINVIGKSGGNDYRGSLFYYVRNDAFDARNFFDGAEKSPLRLNQFGGSIGGPLPFFNFGEGGPLFNSGKNKLFFSPATKDCVSAPDLTSSNRRRRTSCAISSTFSARATLAAKRLAPRSISPQRTPPPLSRESTRCALPALSTLFPSAWARRLTSAD